MKLKWWIAFLCVISCSACLAQQAITKQQALTNESVVKMVKAGLSEGVVLSMIRSQPGDYDLSPDAMAALRKQGVTEDELAAMAVKGTTTRIDTTYDNFSIGVYYKVKGLWDPLPTEEITWRTGGYLKNLASQGIVNQDLNGRFNGPTSSTRVFTPAEFLIETPDGTDATEFKLVHLHQKRNAREYRMKTGGVFHSSWGSDRDAVPFQQKRIARDTYEITVPPNLPPGEYAFLTPGYTGSSTEGTAGKAYTFHLME